MNNRILMRIDFQNDFVHPQGDLSICNQNLIERHQKFCANLQAGMFDTIIDSYDTHFSQNYRQTIESQNFPLHCAYETWGWQSAAPFKDNIKVVNIFKSTTNIWNEKRAYSALSQDFADKEVFLCGVLSDICVIQAMNGLLKRGAKVCVFEDLCQGLNEQIPDIVSRPEYTDALQSEQLKSITSAQFFRSELLNKKIEHNLVTPTSKEFSHAE